MTHQEEVRLEVVHAIQERDYSQEVIRGFWVVDPATRLARKEMEISLRRFTKLKFRCIKIVNWVMFD